MAEDPNIQLPSLPSAVAADLSDLLFVRQGTADKKISLDKIKDLVLGNNSFDAATLLQMLLGVDGAGSNLDADLLDGQQGSFYRNASNLSSGTVPEARLSAATILNLIKGVDGVNSGLDADKLDGQESTYYRNASNLNAGTVPEDRLSASAILNKIKTVDGIGSGLDADLLDGQDSSYFRNASNLNSGTVPSARMSGQYPNVSVNASNLYTGTVPEARLPIASSSTKGLVELATQSEVDAGTAGNLAVLASQLKNGLIYSLGATGYIRFPSWLGNLTIQWGNITVASNGTATDSFARNFTTVLQPFCSHGSDPAADAAACGVVSTTNSSITLRNGDTTQRINWFVIGIS